MSLPSQSQKTAERHDQMREITKNQSGGSGEAHEQVAHVTTQNYSENGGGTEQCSVETAKVLPSQSSEKDQESPRIPERGNRIEVFSESGSETGLRWVGATVVEFFAGDANTFAVQADCADPGRYFVRKLNEVGNTWRWPERGERVPAVGDEIEARVDELDVLEEGEEIGGWYGRKVVDVNASLGIFAAVRPNQEKEGLMSWVRMAVVDRGKTWRWPGADVAMPVRPGVSEKSAQPKEGKARKTRKEGLCKRRGCKSPVVDAEAGLCAEHGKGAVPLAGAPEEDTERHELTLRCPVDGCDLLQNSTGFCCTHQPGTAKTFALEREKCARKGCDRQATIGVWCGSHYLCAASTTMDNAPAVEREGCECCHEGQPCVCCPIHSEPDPLTGKFGAHDGGDADVLVPEESLIPCAECGVRSMPGYPRCGCRPGGVKEVGIGCESDPIPEEEEQPNDRQPPSPPLRPCKEYRAPAVTSFGVRKCAEIGCDVVLGDEVPGEVCSVHAQLLRDLENGKRDAEASRRKDIMGKMRSRLRYVQEMLAEVSEAAWQELAEESTLDPVTVAVCKRLRDLEVLR